MFLKFNKDEIKTGTLKDIVSAKHVEEINGVDALEIETLDIDVEKGYRVVYKDRYGNFKEFIVTEIEEQNFGGGIIKRLYCESSLYETLGDYIEDKRPQNVTANTALANALLTTRWEVGTVDDLGLNSTNFYHISAKEAIQKVAEAFKGEIRTRIIVSGKEITHRYVDLLARRGGDYGKRFTYTKNLESVTKTVHSDDVVTALYGYGKGEEVGDGYGRRLDFADINDGKAYVEDLTALEIWGRNNTGGTKSHVFGKVEFDDVEDKAELLTLTTDKLTELSEPKITYEANVIDLGGADLGDDVAVIDKEFVPELRLKARVIKVKRDLLETQNDEITLGNFRPSVVDSMNSQDGYISSFRDKQGVWDRSNTINSDGTINAQFLNNLVDELNTRMNSQGGYVFISEDGKGLTTYDAPNPETATMAIQLLGGAFRIANSKLPDGSFDWRTFGDGNGFVADSFIGGLLKGGKVEFDLTNGTLLIGNSIEDYQLHFDGSMLKLNGLGIESYASKTEVSTAKQEAIDESAIDAASKADTAENNAKAYIQSRTENLISNGLGSLGDNTNFSQFEFDGTQVFAGGGSFFSNAQNSMKFSDELIPVDTSQRYRFSMMAKSLTGLGHNYFGIAPYDIDGGAILPRYYYGSQYPVVELTQDLKPGDMAIHLSDVSSLIDSYDVSSHYHSIVFWGWKNSYGYEYPAGTYSRYAFTYGWDTASIDRDNNIIYLAKPFDLTNNNDPEGIFRTGHKASRTHSGGTYKYITANNTKVSSVEWQKFIGEIYGVGIGSTEFPPGTSFVRLLFLINRSTYGGTAGDNIWLNSLEFTNVAQEYNARSYAEQKASEAQSASEAYALAQANLAQTTAQVYADGIVDAEEQARIDDATAKFNEAKTYADTKKTEAITAGEAYADLKKQEAISASEAYANAKAEAERLIAEAYADGIVTAEEQARIDDVNAKLATAQLYAETKAQEAETASKAYTDTEIAPIETRLATAESSITQNADEITLRVTQVELTNAVNAVETDTKNLFVLNDIEATGVTVETNGISIDQQESTSNTGEYALGLVTEQEYSAQAIVSLVTGTANANYGKVVLANPFTSAEITIVNGGADGVSQTNFIAPSDIADYTDLIFYGVLDGVVSVSQIQIVKGNLIPKWALSYEDVQARIDDKVDPEQLNYEVSVLQSSIQQTSDSILQTVNQVVSDSESNITAQYSAEVQLAKDEFNVQLSQTNGSITDINNELADIGRYLNFDIAQGLMIGLEDSDGTARMLLDGKSLQFLDDGSGSVEDIVLHEDAVAYIGGKKLYINEAEILEKIRIGNHQMEKYSTGITIFKYVG